MNLAFSEVKKKRDGVAVWQRFAPEGVAFGRNLKCQGCSFPAQKSLQ